MKVLIVDDSVVMRTIVERGLRHGGFGHVQVRHAKNGVEGLAELEQAEGLGAGAGFDLILSDVHMPVMGGPELVAEASRRGLARGVPVVMITGDGDEVGTGVEGGGLRRLVKPFTLEQMRARLAPLLVAEAHQ